MAKPASPDFPFTIQFSVGSDAIDSDAGVLRGVCVAEVGAATGHFVAVDKAGIIIGVDDYELAGTAKRIPLYMDAKGIAMVVQAGQTAGRTKAREDHDDSIGARAGFMSNFRLEDGKAVCDQTVFESYRNRATFFEAAHKTPEMIGLSGDFVFGTEIVGDKAFMRVKEIKAVDIVDQGALTHAGLFRALPAPPVVDKKIKATVTRKLSIMANAPKIPPAPAKPDTDSDGDVDIASMPDLSAFKVMCDEIGAYASAIKGTNATFAQQLTEAMAAITPVNVPTPPDAPAPVTGAPTEADASVKDPKANFAALRSELTGQLPAAQKATMKALTGEMQRQFSALGLKPTVAPAPNSAAPEVVPANVDEPKTFLALKAKIQKERSLKPSEATRAAMSEKPELYRAHIQNLGIYDPAKDTRIRVKSA